MSVFRRSDSKGEKGTTLLETVVALALLGIIGVNFLGATATTSSSRLAADEHTTARIIAESQIESVRQQDYSSSGGYTIDAEPAEYPGYSVAANITTLYNVNIQRVELTVSHHGRDIITLESYKVNRT